MLNSAQMVLNDVHLSSPLLNGAHQRSVTLTSAPLPCVTIFHSTGLFFNGTQRINALPRIKTPNDSKSGLSETYGCTHVCTSESNPRETVCRTVQNALRRLTVYSCSLPHQHCFTLSLVKSRQNHHDERVVIDRVSPKKKPACHDYAAHGIKRQAYGEYRGLINYLGQGLRYQLILRRKKGRNVFVMAEMVQCRRGWTAC